MKKLLWILLSLLVIGIVGYQIAKFNFGPKYKGEIILEGLNAETEVYFDNFGVPHIYASSAEDAYQTLGYVHAQDRLFQMEMMRRVGTGTLAEFLGEDLLEVDKFFRTLGIPKHAKMSTKAWHSEGDSEWKSATEAYIKGVNQFIEEGNLPLEYALLGSKPREFTINDVHAVLGYMSFTFAMAVKTDPLVTKMARKLGPEYMKALSIHTLPEHHIIPNHYPKRDSLTLKIETGNSLSSMLGKLPVPLFMGSNAWVIAPSRTASGEVIFCNDTHIGFSQPSVWYEAHLEYPGFSYYGNHLAGIPFGLVGHTRTHSIGLTMFENDDQDFFEEKLNPNNAEETIYGSGFSAIQSRIDTLIIKGKDPVLFEIRESIHGPIMNAVVPEIAGMTDNPVASWWVYVLEPTRAIEATWKMSHAKNIQDVENGARLIHAPGLNIMYGDKAGNIAWWASAKLPIRPAHVNSKIFLDGTNPVDEPTGWIPFEENPMSINPESGFVATSNNQPDTLSNGIYYPGYYYPGDRWDRISKTIIARNDWTQESIKTLQLESLNETQPKNAKLLLEQISKTDYPEDEAILNALEKWSGEHRLDNIAPTLYYKWIYHVLYEMMVDELGEEDFENYLGTFMHIRSTPLLLQSENSPWWDNRKTGNIENRQEIINKALAKSLEELHKQHGSNSSKWQWGKSILSEHPHPLGAKKPLDKIFNVSTKPMAANEESVNKLAFTLNGTGNYKVNSGPAMRIILDFADIEASESILPTGQSGNLFSPWYKDQAEMFAEGEYRPQLMNEEVIKGTYKEKLVFKQKE